MEPHLEFRDRFGADVLSRLDQGRLIPATDYVNAQRLRRKLRDEFDKLWNEVDCFLTPTTPNTAPRIGENTIRLGGRDEDTRIATTRLVRGINVLGLPALSIPCGLSGHGSSGRTADRRTAVRRGDDSEGRGRVGRWRCRYSADVL